MNRRRIAAVTAGTLTLVALGGCGQLSEKRLDYSRTENVKIDKITVRPGAGDVTVRSGDGSNVQIKRIVRYRGGKPRDTNYQIDGTELVLDTDCGPQCSVSYDITAPTGVSVRGENGSGDVELSQVSTVDIKIGSGRITVSGATGTVRAETGSGDISISDAKQAVSAHTGSGDVTGRGLGGGEVRVETGSGDIQLSLDTAGAVKADASSGSVELAVPAGRYRVRAAAESGEKQVAVTDDPTAPLLLDVQTGSGDIKISQR
jgi:hypothetical protein